MSEILTESSEGTKLGTSLMNDSLFRYLEGCKSHALKISFQIEYVLASQTWKNMLKGKVQIFLQICALFLSTVCLIWFSFQFISKELQQVILS